MLFASPPAPAGADDDAASLQDYAADSATLAAGGGRPRNLKKTMKQRQQPTEPSANELRAMWGAGICIIGIMCIIGIVIVNDVLAFCAARRGGIMVYIWNLGTP